MSDKLFPRSRSSRVGKEVVVADVDGTAMLILEITEGETNLGHVFRLAGDQPRVLGRLAGDVPLHDPHVSPHHARLWHAQGQWLIADLNSAHGTCVNHTRITQPTPLHPGDQIGVGGVTLLVREVSDSTPADPEANVPAPQLPAVASLPAVDPAPPAEPVSAEEPVAAWLDAQEEGLIRHMEIIFPRAGRGQRPAEPILPGPRAQFHYWMTVTAVVAGILFLGLVAAACIAMWW